MDLDFLVYEEPKREEVAKAAPIKQEPKHEAVVKQTPKKVKQEAQDTPEKSKDPKKADIELREIWEKNAKVWQSKLPMLPAEWNVDITKIKTEKQSWARSSWLDIVIQPEGSTRVVCAACTAIAGVDCIMAKTSEEARVFNFTRHQ